MTGESSKQTGMLFSSKITLAQLLLLLGVLGAVIANWIDSRESMATMRAELNYMNKSLQNMESTQRNAVYRYDLQQTREYYDLQIKLLSRRLDKLEDGGG